MKIVSSEQMRALDQHTIEHEPISSIALMERAAATFYDYSLNEIFQPQYNGLPWIIFCGTGNNGGDGLVIARMSKELPCDTHVVIVGDLEKVSDDFKVNYKRLIEETTIKPVLLKDFVPPSTDAMLIDAIFGSGLNRAVKKGEFAEAIQQFNDLSGLKIAVDIPSGLFADQPTIEGSVIHADHTISFQLPKLSFFAVENEAYLGNVHLLDIGLSQKAIEQTFTSGEMLDPHQYSELFQVRSRHIHKGMRGRSLIIGGGKNTPGAAILSAEASIRSGIGLLTCAIPQNASTALLQRVPEAMIHIAGNEYWDEGLSQLDLDGFDSIAIGPGLGKEAKTLEAFRNLLAKVKQPLVLDADAINLLSENRELLELLPKGSVLTPHLGEFKRLVGSFENSFEALELGLRFTKKHQVVLILKGAFTFIISSDGSYKVSNRGHAGMATGGSGDVLTGICASIMARCKDNTYLAAQAAVTLHGISAEIALESDAELGFRASHIFRGMRTAISSLSQKSINHTYPLKV
ncbi:MAG: NAD(P)H-hydrate dehydratase [Cyclobacteriaceae bacterium]|nr:NAD(P)H-hydrate dehydratase [Cyclobacteriaceae bacterium]MCH8515196.1 NAD(P)H-hydrate dehydratase [Cyclobacteriaceae bacterium]